MEIALFGENAPQRPVPFERYVADFADGTVHEGKLESHTDFAGEIALCAPRISNGTVDAIEIWDSREPAVVVVSDL
ncbi:hypothetical protein [Sorangium sp. So ce385]|uniref:hypothetical protein n=1 Tax=Sorangium sp. So ce385 TaxID=3133308 RepID=UPI003F5BA1E4